MLVLSFAPRYLAFGLGILCAIVGFTAYGLDGGVLWAIIGYFLGKAIQSTIWTLNGTSTS